MIYQSKLVLTREITFQFDAVSMDEALKKSKDRAQVVYKLEHDRDPSSPLQVDVSSIRSCT